MVHASAALDLDELSGGRMTLGLGSGTRRMNEEWYGVPFSGPRRAWRSACAVIRALFDAKDGIGFRFEGDFYKLKIPVYTRGRARRAPRVPIAIAAVNRRMVETRGPRRRRADRPSDREPALAPRAHAALAARRRGRGRPRRRARAACCRTC